MLDSWMLDAGCWMLDTGCEPRNVVANPAFLLQDEAISCLRKRYLEFNNLVPKLEFGNEGAQSER